LLLDVCTPDAPGPFPAVILIHGGAWTSGDKSGGPDKGYVAPLFEPLTKAGFAWFSINYRLAPAHRYPACIEDAETAIRWVKAHAAEYHVDPRRIAIAGESAGGHIAALAVVRADESTRVAGAVFFYTPFEFVGELPEGTPLNPALIPLFGFTNYNAASLPVLREASPIRHVKPGLPPCLLLHGTADDRVAYEQSLGMRDRLRQASVPCGLITIPEGGHGMRNWGALAPDYKDEVVAWLKRSLR
jgi:alpha-L-fucosidase 2